MGSSSEFIRVFLVDEEPLVREGLRILIDGWPGFRVVAEASGPSEAAVMLDAVDAALVIVSHSGPPDLFPEQLPELIAAARRTPVIFVTGSRNPDISVYALGAGARWVVRKQNAPEELLDAIERVLGGEVWSARAQDAPQTARLSRPHRAGRKVRARRAGTLTERELEVAILVSQGCTNGQVGERLGITEVTVRHHLTSIFAKLRIASRFRLIVWLYRQGIVQPGSLDIAPVSVPSVPQ